MSIPRTDYLQRLMKYCAEAERSTHDVLAKLVSWAIPLEESEIIIAKLRKENFLNDERFTKSYVSEKWNMDRWGKIKIAHALRQKNIDDTTIQNALSVIEDREYMEVLHDLMQQKLREVRSENRMDDLRRVAMYAGSRGYEDELIQEWIENQEAQ